MTAEDPARLTPAELESVRYVQIRAVHDDLCDEWPDVVPGDAGVLHDEVIWLAAGQPYVTVGGEPAYPSEWEQAAVALRIIAQRHPFRHANKRTAWQHTVSMLHSHVLPETVSQDAIIQLCLDVAQHQLDEVDEIARALRGLWGK